MRISNIISIGKNQPWFFGYMAALVCHMEKIKMATTEQQLPFFKSFYAGGPYSMRAWQVRQLGIGSSAYFDTAKEAKGMDRFGDIQLEGNIEYRFNLGNLVWQ